MYFRFYGWRHTFIPLDLWADRRERRCVVSVEMRFPVLCIGTGAGAVSATYDCPVQLAVGILRPSLSDPRQSSPLQFQRGLLYSERNQRILSQRAAVQTGKNARNWTPGLYRPRGCRTSTTPVSKTTQQVINCGRQRHPIPSACTVNCACLRERWNCRTGRRRTGQSRIRQWRTEYAHSKLNQAIIGSRHRPGPIANTKNRKPLCPHWQRNVVPVRLPVDPVVWKHDVICKTGST